MDITRLLIKCDTIEEVELAIKYFNQFHYPKGAFNVKDYPDHRYVGLNGYKEHVTIYHVPLSHLRVVSFKNLMKIKGANQENLELKKKEILESLKNKRAFNEDSAASIDENNFVNCLQLVDSGIIKEYDGAFFLPKQLELESLP